MTTATTTPAAPQAPARAATPRLPEPGDIILYPAQPGSWTDALIARGTGGPYVHCGVVETVETPSDLPGVVALTTIEALTRGVTRCQVSYTPGGSHRAYRIIPTAMALDMERAAWALGWLARQVGARYGWLDIAADGLRALLPRALGSRTPFLVAPSTMDCSELVTRWLLVAGYEWPSDAAIAAPERQSPNDLARMLNVLA